MHHPLAIDARRSIERITIGDSRDASHHYVAQRAITIGPFSGSAGDVIGQPIQ